MDVGSHEALAFALSSGPAAAAVVYERRLVVPALVVFVAPSRAEWWTKLCCGGPLHRTSDGTAVHYYGRP